MNNINTTENGYINNVNLANQMRAGEVEKNESFLNFVEGLEALYSEALNIRNHIFNNKGRDFKGWVYFKADKIKTPGGFQIAHHSAKDSIFNELLELDNKPSDEEMQAIVHKWDMWHYS